MDTIIDARGNKLELEDTRLTSFAPDSDMPTAEVVISRNGPSNTISAISLGHIGQDDSSTIQDGASIQYVVDPVTRDLLKVTNREEEEVNFRYNLNANNQQILETSKPHLLTQVFDDRGVRALQAMFSTDVDANLTLLTGIEDAAGNTAKFGYAFDQMLDGDTYSIETRDRCAGLSKRHCQRRTRQYGPFNPIQLCGRC